MTGTLVLVRHGEIVRPAHTSNFDRAPLSEDGESQMRALTPERLSERQTIASPSHDWSAQGRI